MPSSQPTLQYHHVIRVLAVGASIVTARHLFANGFHYPLLMLIAHLSIALVVEALACSDATKNQRPQSHHSTTSRILLALFAIFVAVGLVFTYHSFLHNRNTTLGVMLLGLDWEVAVCRLMKWLQQDKRRAIDFPIPNVILNICVVLLLWKENWLVGKGITYLLVAVICMGMARQLWNRGLVESPIEIGSITADAYGAGLAFGLPLAAFLLAVTGWYNRRDFDMTGLIVPILISLVTGSLSLVTETTLSRFTARLQSAVPLPAGLDLGFASPAFSLIVVAIVEVDNDFFQNKPSITSPIQWFAFAIALASTIDISRMIPTAASSRDEFSFTRTPSLKSEDGWTRNTNSMANNELEAMFPFDFLCATESTWLRHAHLIWDIFLSILTMLLVVQCIVVVPRAEPRRSWDLDIVIAWYDEPIDQVISTAQLVLELPSVVGQRVRTIVYNKGTMNETELELNFPTQSSGLTIRRLENVGREGETYLAHILDSEKDWASHTLFIQAEPHDTGYLQTRLEDYFVAETGFLSLSYVRNFCNSCDRCHDHSGWTEDGDVLRDIFERSNPDKTCQNLTLTYRGQFVVSSRRMKQANQELLRDCRHRVIEDDHFGYTLERAWGTLFQCPTISERCPTLLSGSMGNRAEVEDCQCLDRSGF